MAEGGADQLYALGERLRAAGDEGKGLRRELMKAITDAARPLAEKIGDEEHLKPYFPDQYAAVLAADLEVRVYSGISGDPKVTIQAKPVVHHRKIRMFNDRGIINHPVFAQGPRRPLRFLAGREELARKAGIPVRFTRGWTWVNGQTAGMKAGFFSDAADDAAPEIRDKAMQAMAETVRKITA